MCAAVQISERQAQTTTKVRLKQAVLLTRSRKRMLSAIAERPGVTMSEIARSFGRHWSAVDHHLHLLQQAGLVVRRKGVRCNRYELYLNGQAPA